MNAAHRLRQFLASPFARHPFVLQRLRWPNPFHPPFLARELNLYRPGELGDVLMCLAVVRAIRVRNPGARITFITHHPEVLAGHPLLDRVLSPEAARQARVRPVISLRYEVFVPLRRHVIDYLGGCVGLTGVEPIIPLPDFTAELGDLTAWIPLPRPWVMLCRNAGPFTPNKDWPTENWDILIRELAAHATVVELGTSSPAAPLAPRHIDLRDRTTQRQFCALVSLADLVVTPVSSAVHIAAAYDVPTLSIMGGYESPENTAYPRHVALHRTPACSPCWRREPCPFDLKCLRSISVAEVVGHVRRLLVAARGAATPGSTAAGSRPLH